MSDSPLSVPAAPVIDALPDRGAPEFRQRLSAGVSRISPPIQAGIVHFILVLATVAIAVWRSPGRDQLRPAFSSLSRYLVGPLSIWDGAWYERIARSGYDERQATAFWPLYPLLVRVVSDATGFSLAVSGVVLSNLALLGALVVLFRLVEQGYGVQVARRSVWLLALFPFAFFFSAFYSESLFLLLSLATILLARGGHWTSAALVLLLTTLTRSAGVLVAIPVVIALVEQRGWSIRRLWSPGLQIAAGLLGPLIFAVHLDRRWNDPLLMAHIQTEWGRAFSWPWDTLWRGFRRTELIYVTGRQTCFDSLQSRQWPPCRDALGLNIDALSDDLAMAFTLIAIALFIVAARKLLLGDALYALAVIVFPLFSTPIDSPPPSMPPFFLTPHPLFIALALLLRQRWLYLATLGASAVMLCWLASIFARAWFVA